MTKLYKIKGLVIAAESEAEALESAEDVGVDTEDYILTELPDEHWDEKVYMIDVFCECLVDENNKAIMKTYRELFLHNGCTVLSREF